jgi:hypothetical protein
MEKKKRRLFIYFSPIIFLGVMALLFWVVMSLWNNVATEVLNLKPITFWQAGGLFILSKLLFGSFFKGSSGRFGRGGPAWRRKIRNMTPEERDRLKQEWQLRQKEGEEPWSNTETGGAV